MTAETSNARGEWVLVPREPTEAMISHGEEWEYSTISNGPAMARQLYAAMLAAAPQPPAEAQPVAKLVNRKDADGGKTTTFIRPTSLGMDLPLGEYPLHLHPPPSAHVGVEGLLADLETIWHSVSDDKETNAAYQRLKSALAQQPAAVGGMAELVGLLDEVRSHFTRDDDLPDDLLPRIDAALAAQHQEPKS